MGKIRKFKYNSYIFLNDYYMKDFYKQSLELKVVVIGEKACGKTSFIRRLVENKFNNTEGITIGINYFTTNVYNNKLNIWDTSGGDRYFPITVSYCKDVDILFYIFSISDDNFESLLKWEQLINEYIKPSNIFIIINKMDTSVNYLKLSIIENY